MLLIPSRVFLDPLPPISKRTDGPAGGALDDGLDADSADGGHSCLGLAPGSNLELGGGSARQSLTVTALPFGLESESSSWKLGRRGLLAEAGRGIGDLTDPCMGGG